MKPEDKSETSQADGGKAKPEGKEAEQEEEARRSSKGDKPEEAEKTPPRRATRRGRRRSSKGDKPEEAEEAENLQEGRQEKQTEVEQGR